MNAVIFHGGKADDSALEAVHEQLCDCLHAHGWNAETLRLANLNIHPCIGCFNCWVKTPGVCCQADDGCCTPRAFVHGDLVIFLTPITFGGYSGLLKTAADRLIPILSPFFHFRNGEMRHFWRYPHHPSFFTVGYLPRSDSEAEEVFADISRRNSINMLAPVARSLVLHGTESPEQHALLLAEMVKEWRVESAIG